MAQERGIYILGVIAEMVAGSILVNGIRSGEPSTIGVATAIALLPIGADFIGTVRDQKRNNRGNQDNDQDGKD